MSVVDRLEAHDPAVLGDYRLVARLGVGGMGEVFLAQDSAGALAAVKRLHPHLAADPELRRRFAQEVALIGRVETDYTPQFLHADTGAAQPWFATRYLPGLTLAEVEDVVDRLAEPAVRRIGVWLADGLQAIHNYRVVHRDLKPSNVIVLADRLRIVDFGIARPGEGPTLTQVGMPPGTRGYMAPERFHGDSGTYASDLFALAAVLVRLATGEAPFPADSVDALRDGMPRLSGVPAGLAGVLRLCLAPSPDDRPTVPDLRRKLAEGLPARPGAGWLPGAVLDAVRDRQAYIDRLTRPDRTTTPPPRPAAMGRAKVPRTAGRPAGWRPWRVTRTAMARHGTVVAGDTVVVATDDAVHAHDVRDGSPRWVRPAPGTSLFRPVVAGDVLVRAGRRRVDGILLHTGERLWSVDVAVSCAPLVAGGLVHLVGAGANNLVAVDPRTGDRRWSATSSPVAPVRGPRGVIVAHGRTVQERDSAGEQVWRFAGLADPPGDLVAGGGAVLVRAAHRLTVLDAATGDVRWDHTDLPRGAVPVVAGGTVVQRGAAGLLGFGLGDGTVRWRSPLTGLLAADARTVYVTGPDGLTALDAATGRPDWHAAGPVTGGAGVSDGLVHVVSGGVPRAYRQADGVEVWAAIELFVGREPVVGDGVVYLDNGYTTYAIAADTGDRPPT